MLCNLRCVNQKTGVLALFSSVCALITNCLGFRGIKCERKDVSGPYRSLPQIHKRFKGPFQSWALRTVLTLPLALLHIGP